MGYVPAGEVNAHQYVTTTKYVQLNSYNTIISEPLLSSPIVFLTPCKTTTDSANTACQTAATAGTGVYTSSTLKLSGIDAGTAYVCQRATFSGAVVAVGASTTVTVLSNSWTLTTTENPIRQFKSFTVTLTGWAVPSGSTFTIVAQPATIPCGTQSGVTATGTMSSSGTATITLGSEFTPMSSVLFCVQPDSQNSYLGMTKTMYNYHRWGTGSYCSVLVCVDTDRDGRTARYYRVRFVQCDDGGGGI